MSNLVKTNQPTIKKSLNLTSALKAQAKQKLQPEAEILYLLLDGSGSMCGAKWEQLKEAVKALYRYKGGAAIGIYEFSSDLTIHTEPTTVDMSAVIEGNSGGGTKMLLALQVLLDQATMFTGKPFRVVLVSDGAPTDAQPKDVFFYIKNLELKPIIDTVFISAEGSYYYTEGEQLLRDIAQETGGLFFTTKQLKDLSTIFISLSPEKRMIGFQGVNENNMQR